MLLEYTSLGLPTTSAWQRTSSPTLLPTSVLSTRSTWGSIVLTMPGMRASANHFGLCLSKQARRSAIDAASHDSCIRHRNERHHEDDTKIASHHSQSTMLAYWQLSEQQQHTSLTNQLMQLIAPPQRASPRGRYKDCLLPQPEHSARVLAEPSSSNSLAV